MTGHTTSNTPNHCNAYLYILPFRNPIKRIASTISEYNHKHYFPFQILTSYGSQMNAIQYWKQNTNLTQHRECFRRMITLGNQTYGSLRSVDDYSDFLRRLFENEDVETEVDIVWHDNYKCAQHSHLDAERTHFYKYNDMTHIQWFGKKKKYAIKITESFADRSNIS